MSKTVPFTMYVITARGLAGTLSITANDEGKIKRLDLAYEEGFKEQMIVNPAFRLKFIKHGFVYEISHMRLFSDDRRSFNDGRRSCLQIRCCSHKRTVPLMEIYPDGEKTVARVGSSWMFLGKSWECGTLNKVIAAALHCVIIEDDGSFRHNIATPIPGVRPGVNRDTPGTIKLADSTYDETVLATALQCGNGCTASTSGNAILPCFVDGMHSHYYCNYCGDSCATDMSLDAVK